MKMACKSFIFKQFIIFVPFCAPFPSDFFPFIGGGGIGEFRKEGFHIFATPKVLQNKSISLHLQMITSCLSMRWVIVIVEFKVRGKDVLFEMAQLLS